MPSKKELHFFDRDDRYAGGSERYRREFGAYSGQIAIGEGTPGYLHAHLLRDKSNRLYFNPGDTSMKRIAQMLPGVKIIISLRNPIARYRSNYEKTLLQGKSDRDTLNAVLRSELSGNAGTPDRLHLLYTVRYDIHIAEMLRWIPRDRIHFMIFEEWTQRTKAAVSEIEAFLDLSPFDKVDERAPVRNSVSDYRRNPIDILRRKLGLQKREVPTGTLQVPPDIEERLVGALRASVEQTESLVGRRLNLWPQFLTPA